MEIPKWGLIMMWVAGVIGLYFLSMEMKRRVF